MMLHVPDVLASGSERLESLYDLIPEIQVGPDIQLDMSAVRWIHPSGIVGMATFSRRAQQLTDKKVHVVGCQPEVLAYLMRVDFFQTCADWAYSTDHVPPEIELSRSVASTNLLELEAIHGPEDVRRTANRTRGILQAWLDYGSSEQNDLISILSEMCDNICEHSQDFGYVAIQRYYRPSLGHAEVRIAIGDMGIGIRGSLKPIHGNLGNSAVEYIRAALDGTSRRGRGIRGNGFQRVQEIIQRCKGRLFVRSENAAIRIGSDPAPVIEYTNLTFFPGTQVAIVLGQRTRI
ncbi:hypothetical protein ANRL3_02368 [Anaerolineae bacterium]|nr:hypothetical protein ANRL3_02368 [Anaerolineae bacterium]